MAPDDGEADPVDAERRPDPEPPEAGDAATGPQEPLDFEDVDVEDEGARDDARENAPDDAPPDEADAPIAPEIALSDRVPAHGSGIVVLRAIGAAVAALLLLAGLGLALDLDRDGASGLLELRNGTQPWTGDTDGDGLEDGWELHAGLDATAADGDGDALDDQRELALRADPFSADSDGDGIADTGEALLPDCDGDGLGAIAEDDGDADGRKDALESAFDRCEPDAEGDGVLDGSEGAQRCVHLADCDGDGLGDAGETTPFDPLDPDSFGSGVADGVSYAFRESGQPPGADADHDGIPDGWEGDDGLIVWGDLRPVAGDRDLLVEFVRVLGPDSGQPRYASQSFATAYGFVAQMLESERDVHLRWTETRVSIAAETAPSLIPRLEDPYYANVLAQARYSTNPYVTTVVLAPQLDQSGTAHSGIAPIRGMLAAVDYGTALGVTFTGLNGTVSVTLQPIVESFIEAGRQDELAELGFRGGTTTGGEIGLESLSTGSQLIWTPSWFQSAPRLVRTGQPTAQLQFSGIQVYSGSLASTILHEVGHTLGLCHAHEPSCNEAFSAADRVAQATSTMSYDAPGNQLHFLASEWSTVLTYVACPPDGPITVVAAGGGDAAVLAAKYAYDDKDVESVDLRQCDDLTPVLRTFAAGEPPPTDYGAPPEWTDPAAAPAGPTVPIIFLALALLVSGGAALAAARWHPRDG